MKTNTLQKNILSGWQNIKLANVFEFKNGLNKEKRFFGQGTPIINYMDINRGGGLYINNILGKVEVNKSELNRFDVKKGDVFFTRTSETLEEIGFSAVALDNFQDTVFSGFVLRARPKGNILLPSYAKYCFRTQKARQEIKEKSSYTTRALTSGTLLNHVNINLPPLPEQNRIVSVLETWDKSIENLNKKIEIKKQIKKGLMQDLLTGKKRLAGFEDKWRFVNLGDTCKEIKTGKLDANAMIENGKYRFYTCAKDYCFIDDYAFDTEALLVSGNGANVGYVHYYNGKFNAYQRTYVLSDFNQNIIFIKYILNLFLKTRIKEEVREGNTPYITMDTLTDMSIKIPNDINEQNAIANILTTADKEISELEKKLSIIKEQKKFLLNNLITGVIRTPALLK